jgi:hypothetical protein
LNKRFVVDNWAFLAWRLFGILFQKFGAFLNGGSGLMGGSKLGYPII